MYDYEWDEETNGILLTTKCSQFVSNEVRPVFAEELIAAGMTERFTFNRSEKRPLMWAKRNQYYHGGEKVAQLTNVRLGADLNIQYYFDGTLELKPVDVEKMVLKNIVLMSNIVTDTKRRVKELFDEDQAGCDVTYIAFSGGKDSTVLLDICDQVLPASVPVVYSDTDMELPDSYIVWDEVQRQYPSREYIRAVSESRALDNWRVFGPPSKGIKWCCSVHKSTPAIIALKQRLSKDSVRAVAFVGVRAEESYSRSLYEDSSEGKKNASQKNKMPLLDWGSHEVWLYIFWKDLIVNRAYRFGLPRVGCLLCPESSTRYEWFIDKAYPGILDGYNKIIAETSSKNFKDDSDRDEYIATLGWQARKSGTMLKDSVCNPIERDDGNTVSFTMSGNDDRAVIEWLKAVGRIFWEGGQAYISCPCVSNPIPFDISSSDGRIQLTVHFDDDQTRKGLIRYFKNVLKKATSCVACRVCESECTHGALQFRDGRVSIDSDRCVKCHKCLELDQGCWRFRSMYKPDTETVRFSNVNAYFNFGLREKDDYTWVSLLVEMGESFFPHTDSHPLGNKMVDSASRWFQQALLVTSRARQPTRLVEVFRRDGGSSRTGWEMIWMALANNSTLIKWYVTNTGVNRMYSIDELRAALLDYDHLTESTLKGALSSLKELAVKSPCGDDGGFMDAQKKGKIVTGLSRVPHDAEPVSVLYGLYLIADMSGRSSFSVSRDFVDCGFGSPFIPPTTAFAMSFDEFKRICNGLQSKYPEYIELTFTHGNDVLEVFPEKYTLDDIVDLVLRR